VHLVPFVPWPVLPEELPFLLTGPAPEQQDQHDGDEQADRSGYEAIEGREGMGMPRRRVQPPPLYPPWRVRGRNRVHAPNVSRTREGGGLSVSTQSAEGH
jgi:hypothetical protein